MDRPLIAAVAVDLSEPLDTQDAAAGERVLGDLLSALRAGAGHPDRTHLPANR